MTNTPKEMRGPGPTHTQPYNAESNDAPPMCEMIRNNSNGSPELVGKLKKEDEIVRAKEIPQVSPSGSTHYQLSCPRRCRVFFRRKYLFDRCLGGTLLVVSSPFILGLYGLVRATSSGPGFYRQERVGLHGETFEIIKLRSMVVDAEKPGDPQWATRNDPRVTWLGRFLRKLHLDELPQLWNVYKGEMSLVGPRPERPQICEELADEIEGYYQRTVVKPGVTGLAQINLPPDETYDDVRRKQILDLHYIENACLWLDSRMIFATALRLVGVKGEIVINLMKLRRRHLVDTTTKVQGTNYLLPHDVVRPRHSVETPVLETALAYATISPSGLSDASAPTHPR